MGVSVVEMFSTPTLLDGGMATELEASGNDLSGSLWSARLLAEAPEQILKAHLAYYRVGAQIAITASYQASVDGLRAAGLPVELLARSVSLAAQARDQLAADGRQRWVAASVGPYGASLADGSEYRGRYGLSRTQLWDFHRPRLERLAAAGPDLLAVETIPDCDEAAVLVDALDDLGLPAWFCFTVADGVTRAGQPLAQAFAIAESSRVVIAVGVNCCAPSEVLPALAVLGGVSDKPGVVYPNSGETWDAAARTWRGKAGLDPTLARDWIAAGAMLIGGCCRTGPADIAALATELHDAEAELSNSAGSQPR
jgi:homocysteine S-methyltransferase